ncbi:MAG: hypothetical protein ACLP59_26795 [Bryobacteraceae bacterium]
MSTAAMIEPHTIPDLEILLAAAKPDLFRTNAFRVTGLPVDATARDIAKQAEKLRMAEKFGGLTPAPSPLALSPAPDGDMIRGAVDRLRDPERRLVDEFFWFWPHQLGEGRRDPALTSLAQGRTQEAMNFWMHQENHNSVSNVSMHNLAVLSHVSVLDLETQAGAKPDTALLGQYWNAAFLRWKALLNDESFWSRLTARIRDLDDPRLTTGTARRMRQSLPVALLSINAQLAVRAAEAGNPGEAQRHLNVMQASGLGDAATRDALARAVEAIRERIKTYCQTAERKSTADNAHADEPGRQLLAQATPLLAVLDCILPANHPSRDGAHDEVALRVLQCAIDFGNKTEKYRVAVALEEAALPLAVSGSAKERIRMNLQVYRDNISYVECFFCGKSDGADSAAVEVKMHGNVKRTPQYGRVLVTWNTRTIKVPRCASCQAAHRRKSNWTTAAVFAGILTGFAGCGVVTNQPGDNGGVGFFIFVFCVIMASIIGHLVPKNKYLQSIKPSGASHKHPKVLAAVKEGFKFGAKPNTN